MRERRKAHGGGFTLIELLIVVAIIAILALIAVPNFLEAQVRAKVSRVKADVRTIAIACEAYMVDHNEYPPDQDNDPYSNNERGYAFLTSPIAYMTIKPNDPFSQPFKANDPNDPDIAPWYELASGADTRREIDRFPNRYDVQCYYISSFGPDHLRSQANDDFPFDSSLENYDPTNGTVSFGDIYRFGGDYMAGTWRLNGIDHNLWGSISVTLP